MSESNQLRKIESRLQRIANVLLLNASFSDNIGLLNGKMGIAIFFYQYSRYTDNKVYDDYAGELIDEIFEEISRSTPVGFPNGLMGIGWGIEFLVKNGFVEANPNEVLAETDNMVYGSSLRRPFLLDSGNDLFGYGLYYISRLTGREDDEKFETLFIKQHLIYLIDDCERILVHKQFKDYNIDSPGADTINSFLWFLIEVHRMGLFPVKVEKILCCLPEYVSHGFNAAEGATARALLVLLTEKIVPHVNDAEAKNRLKSVLNENIGRELAENMANSAMVSDFIKGSWQGLLYGPLPGYNEVLNGQFRLVFPVIDDEADWNTRLNKLDKYNLGLTGLAGLGLGLLSVAEGSPKAPNKGIASIISNEK